MKINAITAKRQIFQFSVLLFAFFAFAMKAVERTTGNDPATKGNLSN